MEITRRELPRGWKLEPGVGGPVVPNSLPDRLEAARRDLSNELVCH
jgi:hypothetical protein